MEKLKTNKKRAILISLIIIILMVGTFTTVAFINHPSKKEEMPIQDDKNNTNDKLEEINQEDKKENEEDIPEEEIKDDNTNVTNSNGKPSNNNTNTNKPTNSNSSNKPSNNTSNNSNNNKPTTESSSTNQKPTEKPSDKPTTPTETDKNNETRKKIEKTYGIKILYGNEIGDYKPNRITPVKLTDSGDIENYLNRLNTELAKYPKNFFNDFNKKGMPLTIYLIKSANGAFSGFTDYQFMNDIKLTLATDFNFEYTLHHEIMHYIDCYLNIVMYPATPYEEYEKLNPTGFKYGNATLSQIYNMGTNTKGAYFISQYGSTNVAEDRAEVFKYMMARAYKPTGCFDENEIIRKKAELISKQIKTYFPSVTGSAHWDRFIK